MRHRDELIHMVRQQYNAPGNNGRMLHFNFTSEEYTELAVTGLMPVSAQEIADTNPGGLIKVCGTFFGRARLYLKENQNEEVQTDDDGSEDSENDSGFIDGETGSDASEVHS